jgi:hydroxymethylpyrimidine/phosphomethylpyrimidine kinase
LRSHGKVEKMQRAMAAKKLNKSSKQSPPVVLSIAGSDSSAGAGIQADLKAITAMGGYALTAITCVVAEIPGRVEAVEPVSPDLLARQIQLAFEAFPVAAVKVGMVFSTPLLEVIVEKLVEARSSREFHLVVDPVMIASSGDRLLLPNTENLLREKLLPLADVLTPNLDELAALAGRPLRSLSALRAAARALRRETKAAVFAKGGHLTGDTAVDILVERNGRTLEFAAPRLAGAETHGTGCTLSAALATGLAHGLPLAAAAAAAKQLVHEGMRRAYSWGETRALRHAAPSRKRLL